MVHSTERSAEAKLGSAIDSALAKMSPEQIDQAEEQTNALLAELRSRR